MGEASQQTLAVTKSPKECGLEREKRQKLSLERQQEPGDACGKEDPEQ